MSRNKVGNYKIQFFSLYFVTTCLIFRQSYYIIYCNIALVSKSLKFSKLRPAGTCLVLQVDGDVEVLKAATTNSPIPDWLSQRSPLKLLQSSSNKILFVVTGIHF